MISMKGLINAYIQIPFLTPVCSLHQKGQQVLHMDLNVRNSVSSNHWKKVYKHTQNVPFFLTLIVLLLYNSLIYPWPLVSLLLLQEELHL